MDRSNEKYAGSGYLTQASVGWKPRFSFNPIKTPPNFSISGIFRSFLRQIDKLPPSDFKSTGYRLLVEELCAFVEDIDLEVELGLESKLVNFIERLDLQEIKSNQKASDDTPSNISESLGKLPLSDLPLTTEMTKIPGIDPSQYTFGQKDGEESLPRTSSSESPRAHFPEVSREDTHNGTVCEKLGYYWGPPPLHPERCTHPQGQPRLLEAPEALSGMYQYDVQPRAPRLIGGWDVTSNMPDNPELKPKDIPQGQLQLYSTGFPELQNFRGLFKPMVIRYPQPDQVSPEQSPFCTIDSAACQLSFESNWNGLSFAEAEEIWTLGICAREWFIDIAKNIPDAKVHLDLSDNFLWPLYSCPKMFFVDVLRKIYAKTTDTEPAWAQSDDEMDQFLSTCTIFHTLQTIKDSEGIYAPGLDSYDRIYCMYAMQPGDDSDAMNLRHFMRQIVVPDEQTDVVSGEKVTITPTLWDPHKPYSSLRKQTKFTMTPPYLNWDADTYSFTGTMNIAKKDCPSMSVACIIQAYTIEDLPKGTSFETTVEASVELRVRVPGPEKWDPEPEILEAYPDTEEADDLWEPNSEFDPESDTEFDNDIYIVGGLGINTGMWFRACSFIGKLVSEKKDKLTTEFPEDALAKECGTNAVSSDAVGVYGGTHPTFKQRKIVHEREGVISLRWDPEQWLSVIVRVQNSRKELGWESESDDEPDGLGLFSPVAANYGSRYTNQNRPTDPLDPTRLDKLPRHDSYGVATALVRDNVEQVEYEGYNLTLGLDIELVLTKGGERAGARVFEEVTTVIEQLPSTKVQPVEGRKPGSFGSIIFGADAQMKDKMLGLRDDRRAREDLVELGMGIEKLRCIQWRKVILPKILKSFGKFSGQVKSVFTASVHIGKRGGFTLQEVKRIAKTFILYGDLFDYTKMMRDETPTWTLPPDFGSSRHNPYSKNFPVGQHVNSIGMAVSLSDVIDIMNPEMYRAEDYRFDFSKLKSQGTIVLTQKIPIACTELATKWIAGVLAATTAAMKVEDSDFDELAKAPGSWENFELLLSNDKKGISQLNPRRTAAQKHSEECFMRFEDNSSEIWKKMVNNRAANSAEM